MKIDDIIIEGQEEVCEARMAWARKGNKIVKKYRCTGGPRKGRVVSNPSQCSKPINMKKRMQLKRTKARMGSRLKRKSARTKRINPASKMLKRLN
jgi:hypothetical protein